MRIKHLLGITRALSITVPASVAGHHSAIIFDRHSGSPLPGTVTLFSWSIPNVYIHVETQDDAGGVVEWEIETDATPVSYTHLRAHET